jgi:hypothetical protein
VLKLVPLITHSFAPHLRVGIIVFLSAVLFALVMQAIGGGMASSADDPTAGGRVMLARIAIQMGMLFLLYRHSASADVYLSRSSGH